MTPIWLIPANALGSSESRWRPPRTIHSSVPPREIFSIGKILELNGISHLEPGCGCASIGADHKLECRFETAARDRRLVRHGWNAVRFLALGRCCTRSL